MKLRYDAYSNCLNNTNCYAYTKVSKSEIINSLSDSFYHNATEHCETELVDFYIHAAKELAEAARDESEEG